MYTQITNFGPNTPNPSNDPLTYCVPDFLNSQFLHGTSGRTFGKYNKHCSEFMAQRCSKNWDQICEASTFDENTNFPDMTLQYTQESGCRRLTAGQRLVRDTAYKKYKCKVFNCNLFCEPFDPTVANSPLICYEKPSACISSDTSCTLCSGIVEGGSCIAEYRITPEQARQLDSDPVMNKLLDDPWIAPTLLRRIYETMKREGQLFLLKGTRLGVFYSNNLKKL